MKNFQNTFFFIFFIINSLYSQTAKVLNQGEANHFTQFNNKLFYTASSGGNEAFLYETDGTTFGTRAIKKIYAYVPDGKHISYPILKKRFYFISDYGLWASNGTQSGTVLIKQLAQYSAAFTTSISKLFLVNDKLYIHVNQPDVNPSDRRESIWVSDGTEGGTLEVISHKRAGTSGDYFRDFKILNDKIFFNDGPNSSRLWFSDGTKANSKMLYDFSSQPCISGVHTVRPFKNQYIAIVGCNNEVYLWFIDTNTGTLKKFIKTEGVQLEVLNDNIIYLGKNGEFWVSDGVEGNEKPLTDLNNAKIVKYQAGGLELWQNEYYMVDFQRRLWKTNGTIQGTKMMTNYPVNYQPHSRDSSFLYWDSKTDFLKIDKQSNIQSIFKHDFENSIESTLLNIYFADKDIYYWEYAGLRVYNGTTKQVEIIADFKFDFAPSIRGVYPIANRKIIVSGAKRLSTWEYEDGVWLYDLNAKKMSKISLERSKRQHIYNSSAYIHNGKFVVTGAFSDNALQPYLTYSIDLDTLQDKNKLYEQVFVYPNPSTGQFTVCSTDFQILGIEIYNYMGSKIDFSEEQLNLKCSNIKVRSKGMFLVKVNFGGKFFTQKVFVR